MTHDASGNLFVAAVVLAGGRSKRMGRDKATLPLAGRMLFDWTLAAAHAAGATEFVAVLAPGQVLDVPRDVVTVHDPVEGEGPLAAIAVGLTAVRADVALVLGCDTPFAQPALLCLLVERALDHPVVVPVHGGRPQPLCAAVRRDAAGAVAGLLASGLRAATAIADLPGALRLEPSEWASTDPDALSFLNVNTPEAFDHAESIAARLAGASR